MENGLVNLAAIVGGLVFAISLIPGFFILVSRGGVEPPVEEQFAIRDEEDI